MQLTGDGDIDTAHRLLAGAIEMQPAPYDAASDTMVEALYTLGWVCYFGGRAALWAPFHQALGRLTHRQRTRPGTRPGRSASQAVNTDQRRGGHRSHREGRYSAAEGWERCHMRVRAWCIIEITSAMLIGTASAVAMFIPAMCLVVEIPSK